MVQYEFIATPDPTPTRSLLANLARSSNLKPLRTKNQAKPHSSRFKLRPSISTAQKIQDMHFPAQKYIAYMLISDVIPVAGMDQSIEPTHHHTSADPMQPSSRVGVHSSTRGQRTGNTEITKFSTSKLEPGDQSNKLQSGSSRRVFKLAGSRNLFDFRPGSPGGPLQENDRHLQRSVMAIGGDHGGARDLAAQLMSINRDLISTCRVI